MYKQIILGGTFDRLHAGHKAFLRYAFKKGENVVIGLTSDAYVAKEKKSESILLFAQRKKELETFLASESVQQRVTIVAIEDKYSQTQAVSLGDTALLVSTETYTSGLAVNREREKKGLKPLPLIVMSLILSATGEKISSTAIRSGLFDREGNFVLQAIREPLVVSDELRNLLRKPFGTLFMDELPKDVLALPEKLVTVGDVTTKRVHDLGVNPKIAVIDFRVERKNTNKTLQELGFTGVEIVVRLENHPGVIEPKAWNMFADIAKVIQKEGRFAVIVDGEEDLLVLPLMLLLPIGFTILYGQPGEGVVQVSVSEENKKQLLQVLQNYL